MATTRHRKARPFDPAPRAVGGDRGSPVRTVRWGLLAGRCEASHFVAGAPGWPPQTLWADARRPAVAGGRSRALEGSTDRGPARRSSGRDRARSWTG